MASEKEVSIAGNVFDCPICLEQMKTPKYLPCLHTFCEVCLNAYIETSMESTINASKIDFACPICRKRVNPPNQDLPMKDWTKNFPDNYLLLTLMEKSGDHSENCGACWRQNRTSKSSFWCVSCAHPVCADCKNVHLMFNAIKNHRIITLEEFRNQDIFPEIEYYCDQYSGKTVEVFCVDHTKLCCSVCFATKHRSCVDVKSLEDISETRNSKEDDMLLEQLRELIQDTNEMEKEFQKLKQNLKQESEATVEKVTQEVEKTKNLLARKLDEFVRSHKKEAQEKMNDLEKIEKAVDGFKKSAKESFKILSAVMEGSSQKQRFLVSHQITQLSHQTLQTILELPSDVVAGYTYSTDEICQDVEKAFYLQWN
ncbi:E3 ubiquitin-protein ligase TRIM56-like [Saccostrea cucullata]|uniref:E3 ubiquitin-protein ligase TRIM56-like n=1 Tax=Saccostrea cuccullata TaxID=36930 RepID=UPI002ED372F6